MATSPSVSDTESLFRVHWPRARFPSPARNAEPPFAAFHASTLKKPLVVRTEARRQRSGRTPCKLSRSCTRRARRRFGRCRASRRTCHWSVRRQREAARWHRSSGFRKRNRYQSSARLDRSLRLEPLIRLDVVRKRASCRRAPRPGSWGNGHLRSNTPSSDDRGRGTRPRMRRPFRIRRPN